MWADLENKVRRFNIATKDWGDLPILRPVPVDGDSWGVFAILRGTWWEKSIPVVSGEALSNALHGHTKPLYDQIGPEPTHLMRRLINPCWLATEDRCSMVNDSCVPHRGKRSQTPDCYMIPEEEAEVRLAASLIVQAWTTNRYVIVVEGQEFSLG